MLPGFLLALREGVEAALIVGILFGVLNRLKRADLAAGVLAGVISAVVVSVVVAVGLRLAGASLEGRAEEIFEGFAMLVAAALLTWMIFWMHRQARGLRDRIEGGVRQAVIANKGRWGLFGVAFLSVVREGIELVLFLTAASFAADSRATLAGALLGLGTAVVLGWLLFSSTYRLSLARFFQITNLLLILFAAGLVGHGIHEFNEAGWIPAVVEHVYDISPVLSDDSTAGSLLKALFGYNANPSLTEVFGYLTYFAVLIFSLARETRQPVTDAAQG